MKILILGGTGILSTDFTKKCIDEENDVYMLNRGIHNKFLDARAKYIIGDLRSEDVSMLRAKVKHEYFDVVIDFLSFSPEQLDKSLSMLEGLYKQYVFISSATVYDKKGFDTIKEDVTPLGNRNWTYAYNKSLCEYFIRKKNINYTIIRPYVTYGCSRIPFQIIPDGYNYTLLYRIMENKPVALLDNGSAMCTLTNTIDFANILYKLLGNNNAYREAFHITSKDCVSWRYVYLAYCKILNKVPKMVSVTNDDIWRFMPDYYQILTGDKGTNWIFDISKVMKAIGGYKFTIKLNDGLKSSVNYYLSHIDMQGIDYRWEGKMDYMIRHSSRYKNMYMLQSDNPNSSKKIDYYLFNSSVLNEFYMAYWKMRYRKK